MSEKKLEKFIIIDKRYLDYYFNDEKEAINICYYDWEETKEIIFNDKKLKNINTTDLKEFLLKYNELIKIIKEEEKELIYVDMWYAGKNGFSEYLEIELKKEVINTYEIEENKNYSVLNEEYFLILKKELEKNKYFDYPHSIIIISKETYKECTE